MIKTTDTMNSYYTEALRIPRPEGVTFAAIAKQDESVWDKVITAYFQGQFPINNIHMPIHEFQNTFRIPAQAIQRNIRNSFTVNPDLLSQKSPEVLSKILNLLGNPFAKASRLTQYMEDIVYQRKSPNHLLIQQLVSSINLERQSAETISKFLVTLAQNDTLPTTSTSSADYLTKESAIELLSNINSNSPRNELGEPTDRGNKNLELMKAQIADDPTIPNVQASPANLVKTNQLQRPASDYDKMEGVSAPTIVKAKIIPPQ